MAKGQIISEPNGIHKIKGDGNCFFRAISYAISGTEVNHVQLRTDVGNHMLNSCSKFQGFLRDGFDSVQDYIMRQRIFDVGTWATEVEIMAMAHMLQIYIYTYDDVYKKWYRFSAESIDGSENIDEMTRLGIYLNHANRVHYDIVLSVHEISDQMIPHKSDLCVSSKVGKLTRRKL